MAEVIIISSSIVRPGSSNQSGREKIHLTPYDLDLLQVDYTQRGLLFPKPDPETHFISRLKVSLSSALEIYFPFTGRLVKVNNHEDKTVSFYISCDGDGGGAKFVHATAESVSVNDLLRSDGSVPNFLEHFFPANGVKNIDGVSEPLLALQVTEIKDGVFISFSYNHLVADGPSVWKFFNDWSKICFNGSCSDIKPLILKGCFLDEIDFPINIPVTETESPPQSCELSSIPITKDWIFHFTKKNISDLKAKANEFSSSDLKISSLQAIVAHLWRIVARHRGLSEEDECQCRVSADFRQRLKPPLEKECFGNVARLGLAAATVGELENHELGWSALQISKMVKSLTDEEYRNWAVNWVRNLKIPKLVGGNRKATSDSVTFTSSPLFQVYDYDFGWGKPVAVRSGPSSSFGSKFVLFRGVEEGSIDVHATLWSDVLISLLTDVEFLGV